jgi:hypothetical protein
MEQATYHGEPCEFSRSCNAVRIRCAGTAGQGLALNFPVRMKGPALGLNPLLESVDQPATDPADERVTHASSSTLHRLGPGVDQLLVGSWDRDGTRLGTVELGVRVA